MKISIALAAYNGSKYLTEQLNSFTNQTHLPDELVIFDDASTDKTMFLLHEYQSSAPFDVIIYSNDNRVGYSKNFEQAIARCTGDILFISDQDDVWFPNKIKDTIDILSSHKNALVIINDQQICDINLVPTQFTNYSNTYAAGFGPFWLSAGCCTAVRSSFVELLFPFPNDLIPFDGWIHTLALLLKVRYVNNNVLQFYRRHSDNTSNSIASQLNPPDRFTNFFSYGLKDVRKGWLNDVLLKSKLIELLTKRNDIISTISPSLDIPAVINDLNKNIEAIKDRIEIFSFKGYKKIYFIFLLYFNGGYSFFSGWKSALKDIVRK
ncbi:MAG: glycosyltransferase [Chlorobium sp.]|nr:MAG: glycosyltransferase [Chlorobium sp.]